MITGSASFVASGVALAASINAVIAGQIVFAKLSAIAAIGLFLFGVMLVSREGN